MGFLVPLTLFGWIPFVLFLFVIYPPRRAIITAFLVAWLFLPMAGYSLHGFPDYTKMSATIMGVMMGIVIFDVDRLLSFRPKWIDIPMIVWCTSVAISSYLNDLGLYDGASEIERQVVTWGLPYLIGRLYFNDLESIKDLAVGVFIGGLIYVPLCLFEVRMSPQLHLWVYGFRQHSFAQTMRDGGFRPMVFMQHGLMVAMWMGMTSLVGIWLWKAKTVRQIWDIPMYVLVPLMMFTVLLCKSKYALLLMLAGAGAIYGSTVMHTRWLVVLFLMIPPAYLILRAEGIVTGENLIAEANTMFGEERSKSLAVRINNENALSKRAIEKPWFGWGGWGGARVQGDDGKDLVTDSLWIITIGKAGWVGLASLTAMLLLPMLLVCYDWRLNLWTHPLVAPIVVLGMMTSLYMFDHLMNGMVNPIFMLCLGSVASAHYLAPRAARQQVRQMAGRRPPMQPQAFAPGRVPNPQGFRPV